LQNERKNIMNTYKLDLSLFGETGGEGSAPSAEATAPIQSATDIQAVESAANGDAPNGYGDPSVLERSEGLFRDYLSGSAMVRAENPAFNIGTALSDPTFLELFRQGVGFEEAYLRADMAARYPRIAAKKAMDDAAGKLFRTITQNRRRPTENGIQQGSTAVTKKDVSQMTKEERREIIRRVQAGEKISFN
jgi:hypothetical protein